MHVFFRQFERLQLFLLKSRRDIAQVQVLVAFNYLPSLLLILLLLNTFEVCLVLQGNRLFFLSRLRIDGVRCDDLLHLLLFNHLELHLLLLQFLLRLLLHILYLLLAQLLFILLQLLLQLCFPLVLVELNPLLRLLLTQFFDLLELAKFILSAIPVDLILDLIPGLLLLHKVHLVDLEKLLAPAELSLLLLQLIPHQLLPLVGLLLLLEVVVKVAVDSILVQCRPLIDLIIKPSYDAHFVFVSGASKSKVLQEAISEESCRADHAWSSC